MSSSTTKYTYKSSQSSAPNQRQTNDDAFQTLLQSMDEVANSRSGQIPFDSSAYMSILNSLTGQPSNNPRTMIKTVVTVKNRRVYCRLSQFTGCKLPIW